MENETWLAKQKEFLIKFAYWAVWIVSGALFLKFAGPTLLPFLLAFAVAWLLKGPVDCVAKRTRVGRKFVAMTFVLLFYGLLAAAAYLIGSRIVALAREFLGEAAEILTTTVAPLVNEVMDWKNQLISKADATEVFYVSADGGIKTGGTVAARQTAEQMSGFWSTASEKLLEWISAIASYIPGICTKMLITVIATIFTELEIQKILDFIRRQLPPAWERALPDGGHKALAAMGKWLLAYGVIFGLTFLELAAGLMILQVEGAFTIAFLIAVLDILPVLGTGTVLLPWSAVAFLAGNPARGAGLLSLYLFITVVRNIVEPKLVGKQMGLSPVVMLPCMLLGLKAFGIAGLFGAPLVASALKKLNDRGVIRLFRQS